MATKSMSRPPVNAAVISKGKLMLPGAKPAAKSKASVPQPVTKPRATQASVVAVKERPASKKVDTSTFGQPLASTPNKSCMQCKAFAKCQDENKSFDYLCTRFSQRLLEARDIDANVSDIPDKQRYVQGATLANPSRLVRPLAEMTEAQGRAKERSLEKMMSRILESSGVVAQDPRIDDRDLPTAPNFFTWITDPAYAGNLVKPWAKQIEHPTKLFNEWCPHCTDKRWFNAVPVDAKPDHFLEHVTFLEHGVCPRCHTPKSEMVADGTLKPYNELVGLAGQRCVATQHTIPLAGKGLLRFSEIMRGNQHALTATDTFKETWGRGYKVFNRHNQVRKLTHTYVNGVQSTLIVDTSAGELFLSEVHPMWVVGRGWVQAKDIRAGDKMHVVVGQEAFGNKKLGEGRAAILGWLTSEGCITYDDKGSPVSACITQKKLADVQRLYDLTASVGWPASRINHPVDTSRSYSLSYGKEMATYFHLVLHMADPVMTATGVDTNILRSYNVNIPYDVRTARREDVVAYLRALYAGDGYVAGKREIGYSTVSRQLAMDLCAMLTNFGLVPLLQKKPCEGRFTATSVSYTILLTGNMANEFMRLIGFDCPKKQRAGEKLAASVRSSSHAKHLHYGQALEDSFNGMKLPPREATGGIRIRQSMSKEMVQRAAEVALNDVPAPIKFACKDNVFVAEVRGVESGGLRQVVDITVEKDHEFILGGFISSNSSKTFSVMLQITYDLHRVLKSQNPQAMLGVAGSQILTGTFTALTFAQAKSNMWDPLFNMLSEATWFRNYHDMLDHTGRRIGIELYSLKDTYLRYRHRNLLYAPSSPNMRTARGFTRMTGAVDEIGLMHNELAKNGKTRERMNASEIYNSIGNSLVTVREAALEALLMGHDNITMGYFYNISSPFSRKDMIMTLYEMSRGSETMYGYRAATWEMNPKIKRDGKLMREKFRVDAIAAMRDFGAVPPVSGAPFIRLSSLANTFHKKIGNDATLQTVQITNSSGGQQTSGRLKFHREHQGGPCVVAIDAGSNFNSFAVAVVEKCGEKGNKGRVRFASEILLSPEAPAHFPSIMRNVVQPLIQHYGASVLVADRWNSIHLLQQMEEEEGISPLQHSLKYFEFERFRQGIYDQWVRLPALEVKPKEAMRLSNQPGYPAAFNGKPIAHLIYQMVGVQDVPNVTVMKPDAGTDDIFRAVVLGWHVATDPTLSDYFAQAATSRPARTLGVVTRGRDIATGNVANTMGVKRSFGAGGSSSNSMGAVRRASA